MFAAGNEGFTGSRGGLTTVTSPATSKNCICAGATNTAYQRSASTSSSQYTVHKMSISQTLDSGSQVVDNYRVWALTTCLYLGSMHFMSDGATRTFHACNSTFACRSKQCDLHNEKT